MTDSAIISKIWNLAHVLRDDGVGYGDYLEQITYLLFLKMADEIPIIPEVTEFPLAEANAALIQLKQGRISGAAVLRIASL